MSDDGARASDDEPIRLGGRKRQAPPPREAEPSKKRRDAPRERDVSGDPPEDDRWARKGDPPWDWQEHAYSRGWEPPVGSQRLPRNIEAEAALLGAMLIENRILERERAVVDVKHFFEPAHQAIYAAMLRQFDRGELVTPVTLRPLLNDSPVLAQLGGPSYLAQLTGSGAGLIGAHQFARQIVELAARRDLFERLGEARDVVIDTASDTTIGGAVAAVEDALAQSIEMDRRRVLNSGVSAERAWDEAFADMEAAAEQGGATGVRIDGYEDWNEVVGPLNPGDLLYLGGRPSMGKTGVALKVTMGAALALRNEKVEEGELPGAVELFSLEMSRRQLMQRAIADTIFAPNETSPFENLINGRFTSTDRAAIRQGRDLIDGLPLNISDPPDEMMIENFASEVRRRQRAWAKKGRELKLVVVDYLARFGSLGKFQNEKDRVTHISRLLKSVAKQCGVALIVLVQLSRGLEARDDKRPQLADLRDSGSLEQDADFVVFVYRDEYYLIRSEPPKTAEAKWQAWDLELQSARDRMELLGAKRRQGALVRRTGYFVTTHQAIRPSGWRWGDDLFGNGG